MKLPNKENVDIPLLKLLGYLLSEAHPIGKFKAKYLRSVGYNETNVNPLKQDLIAVAQREDIKEVISSSYGVKYIIDGTMETPSGVFIKMRTIWIIDKGQKYPRFVTAYPV